MNWIWEINFLFIKLASLNCHSGWGWGPAEFHGGSQCPSILFFISVCTQKSKDKNWQSTLFMFIEIFRVLNFLFLWFDKEWQLKSLYEHEPIMVEMTHNDKFHLCKWPSKIDTWNNSKRKCGWIVDSEKWSDNIMDSSSQEISIKISQQKPPSPSFAELRSPKQVLLCNRTAFYPKDFLFVTVKWVSVFHSHSWGWVKVNST